MDKEAIEKLRNETYAELEQIIQEGGDLALAAADLHLLRLLADMEQEHCAVVLKP